MVQCVFAAAAFNLETGTGNKGGRCGLDKKKKHVVAFAHSAHKTRVHFTQLNCNVTCDQERIICEYKYYENQKPT